MASWRQIPVALAGALALGLFATPSDAKDGALGSCASTYEDALMHQQAGHLREARTLALQCARPSCGTLQKKCAASAAKLRADIAWIAPVVTDDKGTPLVDVQVKLDQQPLTSRLDGRELPVDPGVHELSATARVGRWPGRDVSATRRVMIVEGQRGPITIALPPSEEEPPAPAASTVPPAAAPVTAPVSSVAPASSESASSQAPSSADTPHVDAAPVPTPRHGLSAWPFVVGGVGALGLGAGALLTYWGKTDNDALSQCSPSCAPSSVDHIRKLYLAADVSFGVGGAALGVAALLFATSHAGGSHETAPSSTAAFDLLPTRSGAVASFQGVF